MTQRLTMTRRNGTFDFAETRLAPIVAKLSIGTLSRVAASIVDAASEEFSRAARELTFKRSDLSFNDATMLIARERPHLMCLTRCEKANDNDPSAEVTVEGERR